MKKKIISIGKLAKDGWNALLSNNECILEKNTKKVVGVLKNDIYVIFNTVECNYVKASLIHQRLAHAGHNAMEKMGYPNYEFCETCIFAEHPTTKVKRATVPVVKTSGPSDLILMDVIGPFCQSFGGSRYALTLIDEFSRFSFVYILKKKSDAFLFFLNFKNLVDSNGKENQETEVK